MTGPRKRPNAHARGKKSGFVQYTAVAPEAMIQGNTLTFEPPLIEGAPKTESHYFWWRMLQFVFPEIVDPRWFPPLQDALDEDDLGLCRRYVAAAEEMAESTLLSGEDPQHLARSTAGSNRYSLSSVGGSFTTIRRSSGNTCGVPKFGSRPEK